MKAVLLFIFAGLLPCLARPQSAGRPEKTVLVQAKNFMLPNSGILAQEQAAGWAQETQENPQNANAWLNYALWTQRSPGLDAVQKLAKLKQIGSEARPYIASTVAMNIIRFLESDKTDSAAIENAIKFPGSFRDAAYPFAIQSAIIRQNQNDLLLYCQAFYNREINMLNPLYRYHANVLQSAPDSAIIAAMGENDLVPLAMVQQTLRIRTDVRLVYYTPAVAVQYKNVYLCLSLGETVLQQYKDASFRGLLLNISGSNQTGNAGNIMPAGVDLDYLHNGSFNGPVAQLNNNYLPSLLLAYRYCKKNGLQEAERYKQLIIKIAREGGKENTILPLLGKE